MPARLGRAIDDGEVCHVAGKVDTLDEALALGRDVGIGDDDEEDDDDDDSADGAKRGGRWNLGGRHGGQRRAAEAAAASQGRQWSREPAHRLSRAETVAMMALAMSLVTSLALLGVVFLAAKGYAGGF